jgi:DDE superfamily endonuclease
VTASLDGIVSAGEQDELSRFSHKIFRSMPRIDQKRWAEVYLRGLLTVHGKRSLRRIAESVIGQPAHQSLQQFLNQSPWRWNPVRESLAQHISELVRPQAWVVDQVVIPKRGLHSVGVERRFVHQKDKTISCQLGIGMFIAAEHLSLPVNWRILLSKRWGENHKLRAASHLPEGVTSRPSWQEIIDMVAELCTWGIPPAPVVIDMRESQNAEPSLTALSATGMEFVAQVGGTLRVLPAAPGVRLSGETQVALPADEYLRGVGFQRSALRADPSSLRVDPSSQEPGRPGSHIVFSTVRLAGAQRGLRQAHPVAPVRILGQRLPADRRITKMWVTNMLNSRSDQILLLARLAHRVRVNAEQLTSRYGLRDFEGRSFRGWHHHMTIVAAAAAYDQLHACGKLH